MKHPPYYVHKNGIELQFLSEIDYECKKSSLKLDAHEQKNDLDDTRLGSIDLNNLTPNEKVLDLGDFDELERLDQNLFRFELEHSEDNNDIPLRVKLTENGQLKWESIDKVTGKQISKVIRFSIDHGRKLHINTGTHGTPEGLTVNDEISLAKGKFTAQDISNSFNLENISIHILSKGVKPKKVEDYRNIDIIDAWCFSTQTNKNELASLKNSESKEDNLMYAILTKILESTKDKNLATEKSNCQSNGAINIIYGGVHNSGFGPAGILNNNKFY